MRRSVKSPAKRSAVFGYLQIILKSFKIYYLKLEGLKTIFFRQSCIFDRCRGWTKRISKQSFLGRTLKVRIDWKACICKLLRQHSINGCWQPSTFWRGCWKWTRIRGSQQRRPWLTRTWPRYILIVLKLLSSQFSFETNLSFSSQEIYFIFDLFSYLLSVSNTSRLSSVCGPDWRAQFSSIRPNIWRLWTLNSGLERWKQPNFL